MERSSSIYWGYTSMHPMDMGFQNKENTFIQIQTIVLQGMRGKCIKKQIMLETFEVMEDF